MIDVGRHVSSLSVLQEMKIDNKRYKCIKKENMMSPISIYEALAKWNELELSLKLMVT